MKTRIDVYMLILLLEFLSVVVLIRILGKKISSGNILVHIFITKMDSYASVVEI